MVVNISDQQVTSHHRRRYSYGMQPCYTHCDNHKLPECPSFFLFPAAAGFSTRAVQLVVKAGDFRTDWLVVQEKRKKL